MTERGLSERRALTVVRMSASAFRYTPAPDRNVELRAQIVRLAHRHRRYGVGMIYQAQRLSSASSASANVRVEAVRINITLRVGRTTRQPFLCPRMTTSQT